MPGACVVGGIVSCASGTEQMSEDDEWQQSPPSDLEFVSNKARNCNPTRFGSGYPEFQSTYPDQVLENMLENVFRV
ncbi:hypothetical protein PVK06_019089 [Gossypium arboreum]|uniref:Uncharacterized protein n=1 Tax=Gossypium arboreum TaxID=29729 RepID=A0ABR0PIS7_GOSAR|nr:hypothetical protein PVK06_019089 [Gossypium arboreum]